MVRLMLTCWPVYDRVLGAGRRSDLCIVGGQRFGWAASRSLNVSVARNHFNAFCAMLSQVRGGYARAMRISCAADRRNTGRLWCATGWAGAAAGEVASLIAPKTFLEALDAGAAEESPRTCDAGYACGG